MLKTERFEDIRANDRKLSELPRCRKSKTATFEPNREQPNVDIALPDR
jgi:hypothetical protein